MAEQLPASQGSRILRGMALREEIAAAAGKVIAERGFAGSSILDLADAAKVSKNQLLHYFGSKASLACAALTLAQARFRNEVAQPALSFPDGRQRLDQASGQLCALALRPRGSLQLLASLLRERGELPEEVEEAALRFSGELHSLLRTLAKGIKGTEGSLALTQLPDPAPASAEDAAEAKNTPRARQLASSAQAYLLGLATLGSADAPTPELCMASFRRLLERV